MTTEMLSWEVRSVCWLKVSADWIWNELGSEVVSDGYYRFNLK